MIGNTTDQQIIQAHGYCEFIITKVSRTFALNIAFLRGDLYRSVLYAYLFCRIADTIEDTVFVNSKDQQRLLNSYKSIFSLRNFDTLAIESWITDFRNSPKIAEETSHDVQLIYHTQMVVLCYLQLPEKHRNAIRECIIEMSDGMSEVLRRKSAVKQRLYFSKTVDDLNRYCYYVAGTVGILLTRLFLDSSKAIRQSIELNLKAHSVSFGLGLQMTNIIKDCWQDYKRGWCYIPQEMMTKNGFEPEDLFLPQNRENAQKTMNALISRAAQHLDDALSYSLSIPRRLFRIRIFCLLPLFLAIATLMEAKDNPGILKGKDVKISRGKVRQIIKTTLFLSVSNSALKNYYAHFRVNLGEMGTQV
ncbi:phytoene/squalene synthase family protein [candidate division KSB1 bacterium]|nr:phytoene/squalene synthase family protein [candidate division KSB1 bacterium]